MRSDPGHSCYFSLHNAPGNDPFIGHTKAMYCVTCGTKEFHFPPKIRTKLFDVVEEKTHAGEFP